MLTKWEKLKATQRMQDYIEAHLLEAITLTGLARCAHYSPWHAAKVFKECTGKTPFEYIRMRRLSLAAIRLKTGQEPIITVAFNFVFDSHEGFTRAFTRQFGLTPRQFRKQRPEFEPFTPLPMRDYFTAQQKGMLTMANMTPSHTVFVQIIERPARKLIVKRGKCAKHYLEYCEEVKDEVWETLGRIKNALHEPMGLWLPDCLRTPDTSTYVQGVEVPLNYNDPIPPDFDLIELKPCKMLVFQGPPFEDKDFSDAITSLWDCINAYKPETYGYAWADDEAPRFQLEPVGYRGYIEGRPVRPVQPT